MVTMREKYDLNVFKKVAQEMGVKWDDSATGTTINGEPVTDEMIQSLFLQRDRAEPAGLAEKTCIKD